MPCFRVVSVLPRLTVGNPNAGTLLKSMPFVYSSDAVSNLQVAISRERLYSYLADTNGDVVAALHRYERNTRLSQCLYGIIQPLEIAFRNSVHNVMSADTNRSNWYEYSPLRFAEIEAVKKAKTDITRWNHAITSSRVVSELTFGFWTKLINRDYEKGLWVPHLYKAFPHLQKPDRKTVFNRFDNIRLLRNRIAHHEKIVARNLPKDYWEIIEALGWICPTTASWVLATATFPREYSK
jgi:hypothetical protein